MHVFISNMEKLQFEYFNGRPEWTTIDISNLKLFMAYSYFGNPNIQNDIEDDTDIFELYKENEKECIIDMFEIIKRRIIKRASKVMVGITMVHSICKENCKYCYSGKKMLTHVWLLLRIKNEQSVVYIDVYHMRTYKDFNDYVQNNELPPGFMYFPKSGMYEEKEYLLTELTPPSRKVESVMSTLDSVGTIINFAGGAVITAGLFYTVATPILISTSIAAATACTYDVYRQTRSLSRINEHNGSLLCRQSIEHWLNLGISLLGTVTAPLGAASRVIETQGLKAGKIFKFGRSFNPFQKGLYITQQSLEIIRFFVKVINKKEVTIKNLLELRLDLFVVTGFLQPINHVRKIISVRKNTDLFNLNICIILNCC